MAKVKKSCEVR